MGTGAKIQKNIKQNKGGYFKIYRRLCESSLWLHKPFSKGQAWIDLINLTNFHDTFIIVRGIKVNVLRGQLARSERLLAKRWGWSRNKLRRFFDYLKVEKQILQCHYLPPKTEPQTGPQNKKLEESEINVIQIITIVNYNEYQGNDTTNDTTNRSYPNKLNNDNIINSQIFNEFRKIYPGIKRGNKTEFENFCKKHKDWKEVLPLLKESILKQIEI